jgi:streptomycin 6-kinase
MDPAERAAEEALSDAPIPESLGWWHGQPGGPEWLERLPGLVHGCVERWSLQLGTPFVSNTSWVAPALRADGSTAVLKINFPDRDSDQEADALALWDGAGAVRLLEHDHSRRALLVERCEPGTQLWEVADDDEATRIGAVVMRRLWRPAPEESPIRTLAEETLHWEEALRRRPAASREERRLVDEVLGWIRELVPSQPELVVTHQDLHGGNVLRATREEWLAIDAKPLVGERAFDTASLVRDRRPDLLRSPHPERRLRRRLDLVSAELGLDRERMRGWGIAHAVAWDGDEAMIACARLLSSLAP